MISNIEIDEIRRLASEVRDLKEKNYGNMTWDDAKKHVVSKNSNNEDDFFKKIALLQFFIAEDKQLCSLSVFLDNLDSEIVNLKERSRNYAISEAERLILERKITEYLSFRKFPENKKSAFDYYQVLIDKVFISTTLPELMDSLYELDAVLSEYYPEAFPEIKVLLEYHDNIYKIIEISKDGATKKDIASALGASVESVGAAMHRFTQLGIFEVSKKGRANVYRYKNSQFDVNKIRKEWDWLWCQPYKRLSLKLYESPRSIQRV